MSNYLGDISPGNTIWDLFNTRAAATGAPITLAGTPAISVYKNSTTESTAGVTLTVDYDSRTGMHQWAVDTSADGTFYAAGNDFRVVLTAGTVDGVSQVGVVLAHFSINNRSALRPATAGRTLVVDAAGLADANTVKLGPSGSGTAQTARDIGASVLLSNGTGTGQLKLASGYVAMTWADIAAPTTTQNLSGTTIKTATDVETDTADIQSRLPAALVSGRMDSSVGAMAANTITATAIQNDAITAAKIATDAIDSDALAASAVTEIQNGLSTLDAAGVRSAVGMASANLDTQLDTLPTAAENATAVWAAGTRTLTSGSAPTAAEVAEAVHTADWTAFVTPAPDYCLWNATRALRNKWDDGLTTPDTYTVFEEDETTVAWSRDVTHNAAAEPVTGAA